ncbi:ornithine carbamoyltransferase [Salinactinospora qingdaonensis]|uniref:Ornithine carbamoyltransferase n=1 Tax=Salinactinospora qingdaonensis TaxID=702744 RepID=A0ABP7GKK9_9ACTN
MSAVGTARHFLRDDDLTPAEQAIILDLAAQMRADRFAHRPLAGPRTVALLFDKPSTRTRISFAVGVTDLGGSPLTVDAQTTHLGRGEPIEDVARVFDRQCAAIVWRTFAQDNLEAMAAASTVPVINALSDTFHPCQILADLETIRQRLGSLSGRTLAFIGDGSANTAHSSLLGGALAGMHVRLATPVAYQPEPAILARARQIAATTGGSVEVLADPIAAAKDADALATDVWTAMGQEAEHEQRLAALRPFGIDSHLLSHAAAAAIVLHCLPAHRGAEITAEVIDGPHSAVWDQAENRRHVQKALLAFLLEEGERRR